MELNQRIFDLLEKKSLKASALAEYLGIKPSSITGWKVEGSYPSSKYIKGISDFLNVSVEYLLTGKEPLPASLDSDQQDLLSLWDKLDPIKQAEFKGELRGYIKAKDESSV